jgi:uncharacterized protein (DUF362 family)/NAD-dependent dihydropyrimidine dehydrogenase PreA subunit
MAKVLIEPASYDNFAAAAIKVFSLFPLQIEGKRVLIKPNVLRASAANEHIVTNPAVLEAVVRYVERLSPKSLIVGDNPGLVSYGANEESFRITGLLDASRGFYRNIGDYSAQVPFNPDFMPHVSVSRAALEADVIISLPKFKTHGLTVMTGAIKNSYGLLPGAQKAALHRAAGGPERFHEAVVEVFRLRPPELFIVDAVVGMEGNGPASPDLREIGLCLASDNAVALDAVIAYMMGCDPGLLRFLQKAKELGLGDYDLSKIEIVGELRRLPDFKLPPLGGEAILGNEAIQSLIRGRTLLRPKVDPKLCSGCGTCVAQCSVSALTMGETVPVVDENLCITCYCCQELCPERAITLG